jgi:hypothetical protein
MGIETGIRAGNGCQTAGGGPVDGGSLAGKIPVSASGSAGVSIAGNATVSGSTGLSGREAIAATA